MILEVEGVKAKVSEVEGVKATNLEADGSNHHDFGEDAF